MSAPITSFDTERLILRQWRETDRVPFAHLCADPEVMKFLVSSVIDRTTADLRIDKWSKLIEENGWGFWAIEVKKGRTFIGFAGLQQLADQHPFAPCVEIGWRLSRNHWGHGYAAEAAKRVLGVAFELLELPEIIATTAAENFRSSAVMERIGMRGPETVFRFLDVPKENSLGDHVVYRLTRRQWQDQDDA